LVGGTVLSDGTKGVDSVLVDNAALSDGANLSDGARGVACAVWVADARKLVVLAEVVAGAERLNSALSGNNPGNSLLLPVSFCVSFGGAELFKR
jgi:hypothetical protein